MWHEISSFISTALSVFFCAVAIKLSDEYLDRAIDELTGHKNWAHKLGNGTMLYAMLMLIIAAGLNATVSLPLFLSSYIIGMFHDLKQTFPSRLTGLQESCVVLLIGIAIFTWQMMLFALLYIFAIQLIDDCIDYKLDDMAGYRNFAHKLGVVESLLLAGLAIISAFAIDEASFAPVLSGTIVFFLGMYYEEAL